jgi:hypothetical protein
MHLTCVGQSTLSIKGDRTKNDDTLHVEIDFRAGTVAVHTFSSLFTIKSNVMDELGFADDKSEDNKGSYNGKISVMEGPIEHWHSFDGLCNQAEPLF